MHVLGACEGWEPACCISGSHMPEVTTSSQVSGQVSSAIENSCQVERILDRGPRALCSVLHFGSWFHPSDPIIASARNAELLYAREKPKGTSSTDNAAWHGGGEKRWTRKGTNGWGGLTEEGAGPVCY